MSETSANPTSTERGRDPGARLTTDELAVAGAPDRRGPDLGTEGQGPDLGPDRRGPDLGTDSRGPDLGTDSDRPATSSAESSAADQVSSRSGGQTVMTDDAPPGELLATGDRDRMTQRWRDIQAAFVDQPRQAVQEADSLVAELMQHLAQGFAGERQRLEGQWSRGDQVSTEALRVSLQRYRSFFQRLLSV